MDMQQDLPLPHLPLARYRLIWQALDHIKLPAYSGSAWRGAFGHSLKKLVCVTREPECPRCLLYRSCVYPYVFETPPDPSVGKLTRYTAAPHPFVLCPDENMHGLLPPEHRAGLELTLFGHGNRQLPYIVHALDQAAQRGLGKERGRLQLIEVRQITADDSNPVIYRPGESLQVQPPQAPEPPLCPQRLQISVQTPLRLKAGGHHVIPEDFQFKALFSNLLRRISMLTAFHSEQPLETDFAGLTQAAHNIRIISKNLRWHDWTRYSSRQDSLMQLGGLLGTVQIDGSGLQPFWPYLWLGQWTHAGKNTSMGLGRYRIGGMG
jgi:hypothetical protein